MSLLLHQMNFCDSNKLVIVRQPRSILANNSLVSHILLLFQSSKGSLKNKLQNMRNSKNVCHIGIGIVQ